MIEPRALEDEELAMEFSVARIIAASPQAVWDVLTDGTRWQEWHPDTVRVEGRIALGEKVKIYAQQNPNRAFSVKVSEFSPTQGMVFIGGMPLGLFKAVRTYALSMQEDGSTHFAMNEVFSGLMLPLIGRSIPDLTPSFESFADGLKARSEGQS